MERAGTIVIPSLIALVLLLPSFGSGAFDQRDISSWKGPNSRETALWALSGTESVYRASALTFVGDRNAPQSPGGHLGEYIWTGDINGDGMTDIGICGPMLNGTSEKRQAGRFYIFYGSGQMEKGTIDLSSKAPDLMILGAQEQGGLLESFAIGDIDSDGNTDLVLGIPMQAECGRVYVLWGKGSWSGTQTLVDPGRLVPDGPEGGYGFQRNNDYAIIAGDLAPVPAPSDNYEVGRVVRCADLDLDGYDDLVFTTPGWNKVNVIWGSSNRLTFGNELTIIDDTENVGRFGDRAELGDINDNGLPDMVITAPIRGDPNRGFAQVGCAFVILDVGRIRGNSTIGTGSEGVVRPLIVGNDPYDRFGTNLALKDLNSDGKDDIVASATESDGYLDDSDGAGSIHVFLGGQSNQFPLEMDSEAGAEWVIFGQMRDTGSYPGDQLGSAFALPDFDGDGRIDLVVSFPDRDNGSDVKAGKVMGYISSKVFAQGKRNVEIKDVSERFCILGGDSEDRLGYRLAEADWDSNGFDDLMIASPSADGPMNERKECGEVYLAYGALTTIDRIYLSGPGMVGGRIACGYDRIDLNINLTSATGEDDIDSIVVGIPDLDVTMDIPFYAGAVPQIESPFDMVVPSGGIDLTWNGVRGTAVVHFEVEWWFPAGTYDITVKTLGLDNRTRTFLDLMTAVNSVRLAGEPTIQRGGMDVPHPGIWFGVGDQVNISGMRIEYATVPPLPLSDEDPFLLQFIESDGPMVFVPASGDQPVSIVLSEPGNRNITVSPMLVQSALPSGLPANYMPKASLSSTIGLRVDGVAPGPVEDIVAIPDLGPGYYDDDKTWNITWKADWRSGDEGSGVMYYRTYSEATPENLSVSMSEGGLLGTYYNDQTFGEPVSFRTDERMEFDWGRFPPMMDIVPEGYSVRWHGWLGGPPQGSTRFILSGNGGSACIYLDGKVLLPMADLSVRRVTPYMTLDQNVVVPIEVYFRQEGSDGVTFNLRWEDTEGDTVQIPKDSLFHPSNRTELQMNESGLFSVAVEAVDWVGLSSDPTSTSGFVDDVPPSFDLGRFATWSNSTDAWIRFSCYDPGGSIGQGSGIDRDSIRYRLRDALEGPSPGPWTDDDVWSLTENGDAYDVIIRKTLTPTFRGFIQFRASDDVGNIGETPAMFIGVDMKGPTFSLVEPSLIAHHVGTNVTFYVRAMDTGGSGVDGSTMRIRTRTNDTAWSQWEDVGTQTDSEEIASEFFKFIPAGWNIVQFSASDLVGNVGISEEYILVVKEMIIDLPPVPIITSPKNGSIFIEGVPIIMDGSGSTDDGNGRFSTLRYTWNSNQSGFIGSGRMIRASGMIVGWHRITLYVDDGTPGHNVSTHVDVRIKKVVQPDDNNNTSDDGKDDPPYLLYAGILSGIIILLVILAFLIMSRRSKEPEEEIRIDYRVSTTSDLDYDQRSQENEVSTGLDIGPRPPSDPEEERRRLYGEE